MLLDPFGDIDDGVTLTLARTVGVWAFFLVVVAIGVVLAWRRAKTRRTQDDPDDEVLE